jgi:putative tryptophan/tyrosine transport system substrate-binding protein
MRLHTVMLVVTLTLAILPTPRAPQAQPPVKIPRIGLLSPGTPTTTSAFSRFRQGLRDLGYVEGQHIVLEYRYAEGNLDRLPDLAVELVRLPVDILHVIGFASAWAAKQATTTIPIVFVAAPNPVARGLVASLARPGGNITGVTNDAGPGLFGKVLELFKEAVPTISRVAILDGTMRAPTNDVEVQARERGMQERESAARVLGLTLRFFYVERFEEITEGVFPAIKADAHAIDALLAGGTVVVAYRQQIAAFALQNRLPLIGIVREQAEAGALLSYGANVPELFRRAAYYVDRILKGAKPADLPVEQPTKFELVINLKTAEALGITIPPTLLILADEVIQ